MITLHEAAEVMPVDWALNCLSSSILIANDATPDFCCTHDDIVEFEAAAPELAQALVDAAAGQLPATMPNELNDEETQEMDQMVRAAAQEAFEAVSAESRAKITNLVMGMAEE